MENKNSDTKPRFSNNTTTTLTHTLTHTHTHNHVSVLPLLLVARSATFWKASRNAATATTVVLGNTTERLFGFCVVCFAQRSFWSSDWSQDSVYNMLLKYLHVFYAGANISWPFLSLSALTPSASLLWLILTRAVNIELLNVFLSASSMLICFDWATTVWSLAAALLLYHTVHFGALTDAPTWDNCHKRLLYELRKLQQGLLGGTETTWYLL